MKLTTCSRLVLLTLLLALLAGFAPRAAQAEPQADAQAIYDQTLAHYRSLRTLTAEGRSSVLLKRKGKPTTDQLLTTFTLKLARPHLYQVVWANSQPLGQADVDGAVWNAGDGPYLFMGAGKQYGKLKNDVMALASAAGISGDAAGNIPSIFLKLDSSGGPLDGLTQLKLAGTETVAGEACHVLEGKATTNARVRLWIAKDRPLIRKIQTALQGGQMDKTKLELSDEELNRSLTLMGQEANEQNRANMRKMLQTARAMAQDVETTSTQTFTTLKANAPLKPQDFAFALPAGSVEKQDLFGNVLQSATREDLEQREREAQEKIKASQQRLKELETRLDLLKKTGVIPEGQ